MNQWLKRFQKEDGLTLIELIVVVAIIGVLAWLITPRVLDALNSSKTKSAESLANEIMSATERYASDPAKGNGEYPAAADMATLTLVATELNMSISKTDGFLHDTTPWAYATNATLNEYCAKVDGLTADYWITNLGVYLNETDAQTAIGTVASGSPDCPS